MRSNRPCAGRPATLWFLRFGNAFQKPFNPAQRGRKGGNHDLPRSNPSPGRARCWRRALFVSARSSRTPRTKELRMSATQPKTAMIREKAEIIDAEGLRRIITRIAHEIVERNKGTQDLVLVGVRRRGVPLAQ